MPLEKKGFIVGSKGESWDQKMGEKGTRRDAGKEKIYFMEKRRKFTGWKEDGMAQGERVFVLKKRHYIYHAREIASEWRV